ncbi:hypothetical protein D3C74_401220 [compost metagenome]
MFALTGLGKNLCKFKQFPHGHGPLQCIPIIHFMPFSDGLYFAQFPKHVYKHKPKIGFIHSIEGVS